MKHKIKPFKALVITAILMSLTEVNAQTAFTTEHVDIGLAEGAGVGLHWHDEDNNIEYEPDQAFAFFDPVLSKLSRPGGAQWDFLGMSAGQDVWILPQAQNPALPFLGVGAEDAVANTFDIWNPGDARGANIAARWVGLELTSFSGPGQFSVWQTDGFGSPTAFMSTATALTGGNKLFVQEGGHAHYNWGFSEEGVYNIEFSAFGIIGGNNVTNTASFTFRSINPLPIPEPSTYALMAFGVLMIGVAFRTMRKTQQV